MKCKGCEVVIFDKVKKYSKDEIKNILESKNCIKNYCYIYHDKDYQDNGEKKDNHYHIFLQFDCAQDSKYICKWFDIEEQNINKLKQRYKVAIGYCVHYRQENKFQYSISEVISKYNDYRILDVNNKDEKEEYFYKYGRLEITKKELFDNINEYDFNKYNKLYNNMVKYRQMKVRNRDMKVIYISGKSGTGKTTLAKYFAIAQNYDYFVTGSGKDLLDGYDKEECIIFDDFRGDSFTKSELFKLLDNNTNSSVKSRYCNKDISNCKMLIITSIKDPKELYEWDFSDKDNESFYQLIRRLKGQQFLCVGTQGNITQWGFDSRYNLINKGDAPFKMSDVFAAMGIVQSLQQNGYQDLFDDIMKSFSTSKR